MTIKPIIHPSFVLFFSLLCSTTVFGQVKTERERTIKTDEVPSEAREWLRDAYEGVRRIRWVEESSDQGISYEAKLKYHEQWHSVEFDSEGTIQDIEIEIDQNAIDSAMASQIEASLSEIFERFRILKVQRQWTGSPDDLEDAIDEGETDKVTTRYEVELSGAKGNEEELWEVLLDDQGGHISHRPIDQGMDTNLNY